MIFSLHEHELRPDVDVEQYESEVAAAIAQIKIPGLLHAYHVKGFKGMRDGRYGVLWVFEKEESIVENFGTPDDPKWPDSWLHYENDVLAKFLDRHPDSVNFTSYGILQEFPFSTT